MRDHLCICKSKCSMYKFHTKDVEVRLIGVSAAVGCVMMLDVPREGMMSHMLGLDWSPLSCSVSARVSTGIAGSVGFMRFFRLTSWWGIASPYSCSRFALFRWRYQRCIDRQMAYVARIQTRGMVIDGPQCRPVFGWKKRLVVLETWQESGGEM